MAGIGIGIGIGILPTLCCGYAGPCTRLYERLYAVLMLFAYAKTFRTFDYASFMRFILMWRMFQLLAYAGFMQHLLIHFSIVYSSFSIIYIYIPF